MNPNPLDAIEIQVPCTASWEAMRGSDRKRFCGLCKLHVYNLSSMRRKEAEALVSGASGKVCVRLYRRPDGTVLTRHCRRLLAFRRAVGALAAGFLACLFGASAMSCRKEKATMGAPLPLPVQTDLAPLMGTPPPPPPVPEPPEIRMGEFCPPELRPAPVQEIMGKVICPPLRPPAPLPPA